MREAPFFETLATWEQERLQHHLRDIEWWDWRELLGVDPGAVERALQGLTVLRPTAEKLREWILEQETK